MTPPAMDLTTACVIAQSLVDRGLITFPGVTVSEAARLLNVSGTEVGRLIKAGTLVPLAQSSRGPLIAPAVIRRLLFERDAVPRPRRGRPNRPAPRLAGPDAIDVRSARVRVPRRPAPGVYSIEDTENDPRTRLAAVVDKYAHQHATDFRTAYEEIKTLSEHHGLLAEVRSYYLGGS